MPRLDVYNTSAKKTSVITLKKAIFSAKINQSLMAQAVRVYLANQRFANAQTKSRGQVITSKRKIWRQKGTGRARHGSRNAPIFVGGAKAHGPTGEQNYKRKLSKQMKKQALFSALSQQLQDKNILVLSGLDQLKPQTKNFDQVFKKLVKQPQKLLLLLSDSKATIKRGTSNLPYLITAPAIQLNTYQVLNAYKLIFTKEAVQVFQKHHLK